MGNSATKRDEDCTVWFSESIIRRLELEEDARGRARTMANRKSRRMQLDRYWIQAPDTR